MQVFQYTLIQLLIIKYNLVKILVFQYDFGEQTGESVKNMAQGALDGVKNSLGMNEKK